VEVVLHLGAHKTGSSWAQAALKTSGQALAGAEVIAPGTGHVRREVTAQAIAGKPVDLAAYGHCQRLVLSDENMLGTPRQMLRTGTLYPKAVQRLSAVREAFEDHPVELHLATRPLAPFFAGLVVEGLRNGFYRPLDEVEAVLCAQEGGWQDLADRLRRAWPEAKLTLWPDGPLDTTFLNALAGKSLKWSLPDGPVRRGPSHAVATAALTDAAQGHKVGDRLAKARGPNDAPFAPWSCATLEHLAQRDLA
ncbi:MAG: hypothetical protein AAGA78_11380, partial [Pseudomonadota bacterium]